MIIRSANISDAYALTELLNEIMARGGTTAMRVSLAVSEMKEWIASISGMGSFLMAESASGDLLGFQTIEPMADRADCICDITTFTRAGHAQLRIGSALFDKTKKKAFDLGYTQINATVMAFNEGGRAYYQSRGFELFTEQPDRLILRYDLF